MRWPWVSRRAYDLALIQLEIAQAQQHPSWRGMVEADPSLLSIDDAPAAPSLLLSQDAQPRQRSVVAEAIAEQSEGDSRLAGHLWGYARRLKREGQSPDDIATALGKWVTTEEAAK